MPKSAATALPSFAPIGRETLQEQAYNKLREALMSGHFRPGQSITLRAAAEALGTSPMPVRDALRRLETERALVARPNRTLDVPEMTYGSLVELREVRTALEGLATAKAALQVTAEELAEIDALYDAMEAAAFSGDLTEYVRANWAFHTAIYRASRSELLVSLIEPTWLRVGPYVRLMMPDRQSLIDSLPSHREAKEALRKHDPDKARAAIMRDIWDSAETLARTLKAEEDNAGTAIGSAGAGTRRIAMALPNAEAVVENLGSQISPRQRGRPRKR